MAKPEQIRSTTDSKHIFLAIFGEPGIGKTRLVGGSRGKVLIIRPPQDHTDSILLADKPRVDEWIINDWDDMNQALDFLRHEGSQYDWVWVDSWSLLQDVLLDDLFETAVREKPARARYGADKQEYGINMFRIGSWMRHAIGPDRFNLGFTAHTAVLASPDHDEDGDPIEKLMPWIQGKNMSSKLCGYMNVVGFLEATGKPDANGRRKRILRVQSDERHYGKDQFDFVADGKLLNPSMEKIEDLIAQSPGRARQKAASAKKGTTRRRRRVATK
jgi:hypothetical protein